MNYHFNKLVTTFLFFLLLPLPVRSQTLPTGLSFIGLTPSGWQIHLVLQDGGKLSAFSTDLEPRNHSVHLRKKEIAYTAADGTVKKFSFDLQSGETVILASDRQKSYAQPIYSPDGNYLFVVEMKKASSADTDIIMIDIADGSIKSALNQRSAQFEPFPATDQDLYYSNVLCTTGCGGIIQEIWRKDIISGNAKQITLLNCINRHPFVSADGRWLWFSSDKAGYYHIWKFSLINHNYEPVTRGQVTDINPVVDQNGILWFIRYSSKGVHLMVLPPSGEEKEIILPEYIKEIRDLRIAK